MDLDDSIIDEIKVEPFDITKSSTVHGSSTIYVKAENIDLPNEQKNMIIKNEIKEEPYNESELSFSPFF